MTQTNINTLCELLKENEPKDIFLSHMSIGMLKPSSRRGGNRWGELSDSFLECELMFVCCFLNNVYFKWYLTFFFNQLKAFSRDCEFRLGILL